MSNHTELRDTAIKTLQKYSLAALLEQYDVQKLNLLVKVHKDKLLECDTYEKSKLMADTLIASLTGYPVTISTFITKEADLVLLHGILVQWRDSVLSGIDEV
ncbi:MAG: hypothetical protein P4L69_23320 [Desulfosporosinus sp.]|nr:hypothetical protein [Desulfosporosinus sp.]